MSAHCLPCYVSVFRAPLYMRDTFMILFILILCLWVFCLHTCAYHMHVVPVQTKEAITCPEIGATAGVSHHLSAGN